MLAQVYWLYTRGEFYVLSSFAEIERDNFKYRLNSERRTRQGKGRQNGT